MELDNIKSKLKQYNQEHLLCFYDELNETEKNHLLSQIDKIDFAMMNDLFKNVNEVSAKKEVTSMTSFKTIKEYDEIGLDSVKKGEYALITMAGGQGTRLGFDGPKGSYILEFGINKSLFELQCDKLKNIYKMSNIYTTWCIMTSIDNNDATVKFFEDNNYFEYPKDKIHFFIQDELPMIDKEGKILLKNKYSIVMGANGNGGVFSSLSNSGLLNKLKENNVKWLFIGGIDNILIPFDDLDLLGFAIKNNFSVASKIIEKGYPDEKVGIFCKRGGKPSVIEYIEMTNEMNNLKDSNGVLVYKDAHILCNLFNISVLDKIKDKSLKYVGAYKKIDYMKDNGEYVVATEPNAYKFESFIFDAFSYVDDIGLLQGEREDVFAPIKNATGIDSPQTASTLYLNKMNNIS